MITKNLSVRATEELVRKYKNPYVRTRTTKRPLPAYAKNTKKELEEIMDNPVDIKISKKGKGTLLIPFANKEDLQRILNLFKK